MHIDEFVISDDLERLDFDLIHACLSQRSYWAAGRPMEIVQASFKHALALGLYRRSDDGLVGFCRVVTDFATVAYLVDLFILEDYRGEGLGKHLVEAALKHPALSTVKRWKLSTNDAHGLYERYGFHSLKHPEYGMEMER